MSGLFGDLLFKPQPRVGQNVVFLGGTDAQFKWGSGYADHSVLTPGDIYWVSRVEEHTWHTKVWLGEGDLGPFNSVCFDALLPPEPQR